MVQQVNADIIISRDTDKLTLIEGETLAGTDFIDSYLQGDISVIDAGRIMIPTADVHKFIEHTQKRGLTVRVFEVGMENCPAGEECALNKGAIHCFHCRRNWPRDETWDTPFAQRPRRAPLT